MLVCHCKGLTDRDVRSAIEAGACTRRDVVRRCGAGSVCGGCRPLIDELLGGDERPPPARLGFELSAAS
jgi:bacterioferritin-associated ferredoxin